MKKLASIPAAVACVLLIAAPAQAVDGGEFAPVNPTTQAIGSVSFTELGKDEACTATAVAAHWAVTAHHCIDGLTDTSGKLTLGQGDDRKSYDFDFSEVAPADDIALLHVPQDLGLAHYPTIGEATKGDKGEVYGWSTNGMGKTGKLPFVRSTVEDVASHPLYGGTTALHLKHDNGAVTQPGDSGGPFVRDGKIVAVGSVSLGAADQSDSAAYVPLATQREWIEKKIATPEDQVTPPATTGNGAKKKPDISAAWVWGFAAAFVAAYAAMMVARRRATGRAN